METHQAQLRASDQRGILGRVSLADGLTIANGLCGLLVVATALPAAHGRGLSHHRLLACVGLVLLGTVLDLADGCVARWRGGSGMGTALDGMADALTFGAGPAAILIATAPSLPAPWRTLVLPVACLLVGAAMLRLARFSSFPAPAGGGFLGLPTPAAAGAVLALILVRPVPAVLLAGVLLVSGLMISELPYRHPTRRTVPVLSGYGALIGAALFGLLPLWPLAAAWLAAVVLLPLTSGLRGRIAQWPIIPHLGHPTHS